MDYKEMFKKYWFVGIVALVLLVFIGMYAADAYKNREIYVKNKQVDGKDVVYTLNGEPAFADDLFETLYDSNGIASSFSALQRSVLDQGFETTQEMSDIAANYASYVVSSYGQDTILEQLKTVGYTGDVNDITQYYIDGQKQNLMCKEFLDANWDKEAKPYVDENEPRIIYHILVTVKEKTESTDEEGNVVYTAKPTEEETKKLNDVLEALKTRDFTDVAAEMSDDGSAQIGGYIGIIGKNNATDYYDVFSKKSLELKEDEVSDVITSQAGYHIIWNAGMSKDKLLANEDFMAWLEKLNPVFGVNAVMDKANELGYVIKDQKLLDAINAEIGE